MAREIIDGKKTTIEIPSRNPSVEFDRLQMYFAKPYVIDLDGVKGKVTIYQPTIGDIMNIGEKKFYSTLNVFVTNTTSYRVMLWDSGLDWNVVSDFELFMILIRQTDPDVIKLIFHDLDFRKFVPTLSGDNKKILYDAEDEIEITEMVYFHISQYLRAVFQIYPKEQICKNETMKQWYINSDKRVVHSIESLGKKDSSDTSMLAVISACVNHPGFKYNLKELTDVGVCQFYDSVKRLQIYESSTALMKGMYSGFMDSSKVKSEEYNFMREI